ncbi:hypothetical protein [Paenibacillus sp. FSL K6-1230]|uniref:hypothetical protein n=1 Tax=Paenibacillus sp. FSL K6-1230 TaxID=2921603 RepID=UPI0030FB8032
MNRKRLRIVLGVLVIIVLLVVIIPLVGYFGVSSADSFSNETFYYLQLGASLSAPTIS